MTATLQTPTEAAAVPPVTPAPAATPPVAATPTPGAPEGSKQEATPPTPAKAEAPKGLLDTPEVKKGETAETPKEAPKPYEWKFDDGVKVAPDVLNPISEIAQKHGLSNEAANAIVNTSAKALRAQHAAAVKLWSTELAAHKELGGDKLEQTLAKAHAGLKEFAGGHYQAVANLLRDTGLQHHVGVVAMLAAAYEKVGGDELVSGSPTPPASDPFQKLYPKSTGMK